MISRRSLFAQLGLLGLGGGAALLYRNRVLFPPPQVTFAGGLPRTPWIDFPAAGGLIRLPGTIGGAQVQVVVDSGAEYSAVDRELADRLRLEKGVPLPILAFGVTGQPTLTQTVTMPLDLGAISLAGLHAATLELGPLARASGQAFDVLLGRDVLKSLVMDIDFPGERLAFARPAVFAPPADAVAVPVTRSRGALQTPVAVEGAGPVQALIDTGMTGMLALSADAAEASGLLKAGRSASEAKSVGLGGVSIDRVVLAREVAFAGLVLREVPVQIYEPAALGLIPAALIGTGLLAPFRIALDLPRGRLHMAPGVPAAARRLRRRP